MDERDISFKIDDSTHEWIIDGRLAEEKVTAFRLMIWDYYKIYGRRFAWRNVEDPYLVVVSEIMLQQTQTQRVSQKFEDFITAFPTFHDLAVASVRDILYHWQGLGYNRRALALQKTAQIVVDTYNGRLPDQPDILEDFPGIGPATASSICAFAFNKPTIFIETNIRALFIFHFFRKLDKVSDAQIFPLVAQVVDQKNPREWYYALMDYGVMLKKKFNNPARMSKHHVRQSTFEGSDRQIRGGIIKILLDCYKLSYEMLCQQIADQYASDHPRVCTIIDAMIKENFVQYDGGYCRLKQ